MTGLLDHDFPEATRFCQSDQRKGKTGGMDSVQERSIRVSSGFWTYLEKT